MTLAVDKASLAIDAGASAALTVTLSGGASLAGTYSGAVTLQGSGVTMRIPYLFVVSDNTPYNFIWLSGDGFVGTVGQNIPDGVLSFKLTDQFGIGVANVPITWTARNGGSLQNTSTTTDRYGIGYAEPILGTTPGSYEFTASVAGDVYSFSGRARAKPTVTAVVEGASFDNTHPIAPGSYVTIAGSGLSESTRIFGNAGILPLAMDYVSVSFDVPAKGISVPGHVTYISPTQVNVHVPWELQGSTDAQVKVNLDFSNSNVLSVPIADYSPGFFGGGNVAALDVNFQAISASNPAKHGELIQLFVNGLGPVSDPPKSGEPAVASPLSRTTTIPLVTIGGQDAPVQFSGLAPGFAGLYQVNVTVPASLAAGTYPVVMKIGGKTSNPANVQVQ